MCVCARRVYRLPVPPTPSHTGPKHAILGRQRPGIDKNAHRISHSLSLCVLSTKLKQAAVAVDTTALGPPGMGVPGTAVNCTVKGRASRSHCLSRRPSHQVMRCGDWRLGRVTPSARRYTHAVGVPATLSSVDVKNQWDHSLIFSLLPTPPPPQSSPKESSDPPPLLSM